MLHQAGFASPEELPLGQVIGVADLLDCVLAEDLDEVASIERYFGHFGPGQWVWRFANVRPLPKPIPARGRLGVFDLKIPTRSLTQEGPALGEPGGSATGVLHEACVFTAIPHVTSRSFA